MKRKLTIGLPRVFLYYKYNTLWKKFFKYLNCNIIVSPSTNEEIIDISKIINLENNYLKIYYSHIFYLNNKCDYILIPKTNNKEEDNIKKILPNINIISYKIYKYNILNIFSYINLGLKITKNIFVILYALIKAYKKYCISLKSMIKIQNNILYNNNKKILLIEDYNSIYDKCIDNPSFNYLKNNNIDIIYGNLLNKKIALSYYKNNNDYIYSKQLTGSIFYYLSAIDGIIFINNNFDIDGFINKYNINKKVLIINTTNYDDTNYMLNKIISFTSSL